MAAPSKLPFTELPWFVLDGRVIEFPEGLKTDNYNHTLHRFPGKFVPQVAKELLDLTGVRKANEVVLDPFCGSGTLLIEAACRGIKAIGLDIDPLASFIAGVKTTPLTETQLKNLREFWRQPMDEELTPASPPQVKNLAHWFSPVCVDQLARIKSRIQQIECVAEKNFSFAVFSSIIRRVSNADDQTQKTYVSGTLKKSPPLPTEIFPVFMYRALKGAMQYSEACTEVPAVIRADARTFTLDRKVSGIATSPPYIDSIDYVYNQMVEYFWLYDVLQLQNLDQLKLLRAEPMGFAKAEVEGGMKELKYRAPAAALTLSPVIEHINRRSPSEAANVIGYFLDFAKHLDCVGTMLCERAPYTMIVGESLIRGALVPTPEILIGIFKSYGFNLVGRCSYRIKRHYMKFPRRQNSGTIKVDHVLAFRK
jgi:hypothetical protein